MPLQSSCCVFSFAIGRGVSFFSGIQHSPVDVRSATSGDFDVLPGEDEYTSFYSTILPTSIGSQEKAREFQKKKFSSALLTMLKLLAVWITTNWKILQEMGMPDHLICLLRNLYAGQEATLRTSHGTMDWFQIERGVCQGCILSPSYLI